MTPQEAIYELAEACLVRCAGEPSEDCLDCEINMAMEALEKTRWIPCSERLPEIAGRYLISRTDYDGVNDKCVNLVEIMTFDPNNECSKEFFVMETDAWQPLPEPWEGEITC